MGIKEKLESFNSLRPILLELCKKKLQGGGQIDTPSRYMVKTQNLINVITERLGVTLVYLE